MLLICSHAKYNDLLRINPLDGSEELVCRQNIEKDAIKTVGFFSVLGGVRVSFFNLNGVLMLDVGKKQYSMGPSLTASVDGPKQARTLNIAENGNMLHRLTYRVDDREIPGDLTPFRDEEASDFGLLVANIVMSPLRQAVLLGKD